MSNVAGSAKVKKLLSLILIFAYSPVLLATITGYYRSNYLDEGIYPERVQVCYAYYSEPRYPPVTTEEAATCDMWSKFGGQYTDDTKLWFDSTSGGCRMMRETCSTGQVGQSSYSNMPAAIFNVDCTYRTSEGKCSATAPEGETCTANGSTVEPFYDCVAGPICTDFTDCYNYAYTNNCQSVQDDADLSAALCYTEEEFQFTDTSNFSLACSNDQCITGDVDIDEWEEIPDFELEDEDNEHTTTDNVTDLVDPTGGGGTGGSFGTGSGTGSGDSTDDTSGDILTKIDDSMIVNATDNQTTLMTDHYNQITETTTDNGNRTIDALGDLGTQNTKIGNALGEQLQENNALLDSIENNLLAESTGTIDGDSLSLAETRKTDFTAALALTDVGAAFSNVTNLIKLSAPTCSPLSIDLSSTVIAQVLSTNIICDGFDAVGVLLGQVMTVVYMFVGFRIFAAA